MKFENSYLFAKQMDQNDSLSHFRNRFHIPVRPNGDSFIYFCGNSLGCQPRSVRRFLETELSDWEKLGVEGHFLARNPWMPYHEFLTTSTAQLVGALPEEVVVMNSLTTNLHLLMVSFYRPVKTRFKIVIESDAFPSDAYAVESQLKFHGYSPEEGLIKISPREGETLIREEDISALIKKEGKSIALILLGGVNYYTGQLFDIKKITALAHQKDIMVGWDLAHAAGNVILKLHEWEVDFAAWCSYKYLNSGPGAVAGCFIHQKHVNNPEIPRFAGWWGHDKSTRFKMEHGFQPIPTAEGWQLSNAPVFSMAALRASMEIFDEAGMEALTEKSKLLTGYLEFLLKSLPDSIPLEIITPANPEERGCQLSLRTFENGKKIHEALTDSGIICDWREPDVIRVAPVPLYNTFWEVWKFVQILKTVATDFQENE
ncbi:MAG: kynureninase [Bacteroidia bacterium]|nr:kynureninase [Bacteroidia bacterium]